MDKIYIPKSNNPISKKRLIMQYLRWLPAKIGLVNKTAFLHQIKTIYPNDTFLVSYPKSGNTWLRYILAYLIKGTEKIITDKELNRIIPDIYVDKDIIDAQKHNRIIKTHDLYFEDYPKIIYIYRDYRDAVVSYYHYCCALGRFSGSLSEFIKSDIVLMHGSWPQHLKKIINHKKENPNKVLMISYESLFTDFEKNVKEIIRFMEIKTKVDIIKIKEITSFDNLKQNEQLYGSEFKQVTQTSFFRDGKSGDWKNVLKKKDLDYIYSNKDYFYFLKELGYIN